MKRIIRKGTFETNSSSTHSLTFMTKDQFDKWRNGELYKERYGDRLYTKEEYDKLVEKTAEENNTTVEELKDAPSWEYELPESYEEWRDDEYLETDYDSYTTEHGDEIVAVCKYGYDG